MKRLTTQELDCLGEASEDATRQIWQELHRARGAEARFLEAAKAVFQCRYDGTFGPDGNQGFTLLKETIEATTGQAWKPEELE